MSKKTYRVLKKINCPSCGNIGMIKRIMYGMPGPDFNFEKFIVSGCCVTGRDPKYGCKNCDWKGDIE